MKKGKRFIMFCNGNQGFPGGSAMKNLPAMQEMCVRSLGREDPLEKEMATHSNIPDWEIPWTEEPGRVQSMWWQRVKHNLETKQQKSANLGKWAFVHC